MVSYCTVLSNLKDNFEIDVSLLSCQEIVNNLEKLDLKPTTKKYYSYAIKNYLDNLGIDTYFLQQYATELHTTIKREKKENIENLKISYLVIKKIFDHYIIRKANKLHYIIGLLFSLLVLFPKEKFSQLLNYKIQDYSIEINGGYLQLPEYAFCFVDKFRERFGILKGEELIISSRICHSLAYRLLRKFLKSIFGFSITLNDITKAYNKLKNKPNEYYTNYIPTNFSTKLLFNVENITSF